MCIYICACMHVYACVYMYRRGWQWAGPSQSTPWSSPHLKKNHTLTHPHSHTHTHTHTLTHSHTHTPTHSHTHTHTLSLSLSLSYTHTHTHTHTRTFAHSHTLSLTHPIQRVKCWWRGADNGVGGRGAADVSLSHTPTLTHSLSLTPNTASEVVVAGSR